MRKTQDVDGEEKYRNGGFMQQKISRPMSKNDLKRNVTIWERKYKDQKNTLSQAVDDQAVLQVWDTSKLSTVEVALIHEHILKMPGHSLMMVQLKR